MKLWKLTIRPLRVTLSERKPFCKYVALADSITTEKQAVAYIQACHFTLEWWENNLLQEIEFVDLLWHVQGT